MVVNNKYLNFRGRTHPNVNFRVFIDMKLIITESQLNTIISEYFDREQIYIHKKIMDSLKGAPGYLWKYAKGLPRFYVRDENGEPYKDQMGEKIVFTRIPEVIYNYIHGNY